MNGEFVKVSVEHIRDGLIEEFHEGVIYFSFPFKKSSYRDETPYYLRSCAKPLQASLIVDYGIEMSEEELAFCSGSHAGEDCHIKIGRQILNKIGLGESYLKCGIHAPLSKNMQNKMLLEGDAPRAIHNNCSGKHIGFLAICKKMGWDLYSYEDISHPLQIVIKNKIKELCEITDEYPVTTDGCGVPILSMPLSNMAIGYLNLFKNYPQIVMAIKNNSYIFGGENRTDTEIIQGTNNIIAKVGAGGLCVVLNYAEQKAFVVKMNDASYEARKCVLFEIIKQLGWGNLEYDNQIKTLQGKVVGEIITRLIV